jgi:hypothetical protein
MFDFAYFMDILIFWCEINFCLFLACKLRAFMEGQVLIK